MDPQLITAGGIDITTADFLYLSYSALDKLVVQLKTAHTAAIQAKHRAILYHKFDNPPKACSQDFNSLLLTRYGEDAESSQVFLSSLSLPAFLEVIYSLTKKHLEAGEKYLTDFAIYANKRSKLSESLVNRARRELQRGSEDRHLEFEREVRRCQAAVPKHSASRKRRRTKTPLNNQSTQDGAQPSTVLNDVSMIPSVSGDLLYREGQSLEKPTSTDAPSLHPPNQPSPHPLPPIELLHKPPPGDILKILDANYVPMTKERLSTFLDSKGDAVFYILFPVAWKLPPLIQVSPEMAGELLSFLRI
ncbi:uncharacterized protein K444DRAFT_617197 [Hyaloscypha bicolor E]|uniref:Uncharacterized protein n=1 Tax=Hyaloscypha bicolor E TaxID=1095630 RepID=A0A2J6SXI8_9HELO|nr:uncharacterized protein K444DRAFT_617197 [Hyaloscypha bicolor E]PMD55485.1 hypothetical protein K444DRAFT_617197 [Hyaloscypha bicolor E]